jgi:type VII secretion protein EccB
MSLGLLNAFPLVDPITPVTIEGVGEPSAMVGPDYAIGSIVKTVDSRGQQLYVVLRDGLQPISDATADIIRYGDPDAVRASAREIAPATVAAVPILHQLPVDHYPAVPPQIVPPNADPVVCMGWQRSNAAVRATVRLIVGHKLPAPAGAEAVRLATTDGNGPGLDSVYMTPGSGEYVQATGVEPGSQSTGPLFYVSDTGLRYHIKDLPTADALGVVGVKGPGEQSATPQTAPWPVLSLLPSGPELSQEAALVAHDGVAADPNSVAVPQPKS